VFDWFVVLLCSTSAVFVEDDVLDCDVGVVEVFDCVVLFDCVTVALFDEVLLFDWSGGCADALAGTARAVATALTDSKRKSFRFINIFLGIDRGRIGGLVVRPRHCVRLPDPRATNSADGPGLTDLLRS
jgi:hypothetical protein